ncbi:MAG: hypothetical protein ACRDH5_17190, partial [bacterium]
MTPIGDAARHAARFERMRLQTESAASSANVGIAGGLGRFTGGDSLRVIWIEGFSGSLGIALPTLILAPRRKPTEDYSSPLAARAGSFRPD